MRDKIKDEWRLRHILDSINVLLENRGRYTYEEVAGDLMVYMLTKEFKETHPEVEWEVIEGMRHVLVHGYYKIKPVQLWNTIENDIPVLKPFIEKYYMEVSEKS